MSDFGSYKDEADIRPSSASGEGQDLMRVILRNDAYHSGNDYIHVFPPLNCSTLRWHNYFPYKHFN